MSDIVKALNPLTVLKQLTGGDKKVAAPEPKVAPTAPGAKTSGAQAATQRRFAGLGRQGTALSEGSKLG
jgi:hypothetical protein